MKDHLRQSWEPSVRKSEGNAVRSIISTPNTKFAVTLTVLPPTPHQTFPLPSRPFEEFLFHVFYADTLEHFRPPSSSSSSIIGLPARHQTLLAALPSAVVAKLRRFESFPQISLSNSLKKQGILAF
jgi:hypothetical protein